MRRTATPSSPESRQQHALDFTRHRADAPPARGKKLKRMPIPDPPAPCYVVERGPFEVAPELKLTVVRNTHAEAEDEAAGRHLRLVLEHQGKAVGRYSWWTSALYQDEAEELGCHLFACNNVADRLHLLTQRMERVPMDVLEARAQAVGMDEEYKRR